MPKTDADRQLRGRIGDEHELEPQRIEPPGYIAFKRREAELTEALKDAGAAATEARASARRRRHEIENLQPQLHRGAGDAHVRLDALAGDQPEAFYVALQDSSWWIAFQDGRGVETLPEPDLLTRHGLARVVDGLDLVERLNAAIDRAAAEAGESPAAPFVTKERAAEVKKRISELDAEAKKLEAAAAKADEKTAAAERALREHRGY